jgi:uncharacterized protein (DUF1330 family)
MPKGYWIARIDVADAVKYKACVEANAKPFKLFGARFRVRLMREARPLPPECIHEQA